jgi:hypothetical protein
MRADLITRALAGVIDRSADARTSDGAQTGISMIERREVRQRGAFALRAQHNERDEHERTSGQRQDAGDRRQPRAELQQRCASRKRRQRGDDRKGGSGGFRCGLGHAERA